MSLTMSHGVLAVLSSATVPTLWSERARAAMEEQRQELSFLSPDSHSLVVSGRDAQIHWYTFGGSTVNQIVSRHLTEFCGLPSEANEWSVTFDSGTDAQAILEKIKGLDADDVIARMTFDEAAVEALKFHQTLPPELQQRVLRGNLVDRAALARVLGQTTRVVMVGEDEEARNRP